jgi:hypothetical protein
MVLTLLIASALLIGGSGSAGARSRHNSEDLRESRTIAEQFLQYLGDGNYDAAYELGASRFKSLMTRQSLKSDVEERERGGTVQGWRLKAYKAMEGRPRYMFLLYHVEGSKVTGDWEIAMELLDNPYQWRVWGIKGIDDSPANRNAQAARVTAEQFLRCFKDHAYQIAGRLYSPRSKMVETRTLRSFWEETEKRKGALIDWALQNYFETPAEVGGDRKEYVRLVYLARRVRGEDEVTFTMVKIGTQWRVEVVDFADVTPTGIPEMP